MEDIDVSEYIQKSSDAAFDNRHLGWVRRYASDMNAVFHEFARVVKKGGKVVIVVGNSFLRGATVDNARLVEDLAYSMEFATEGKEIREIPAHRRYLPPTGGTNGKIDICMREETALTLRL